VFQIESFNFVFIHHSYNNGRVVSIDWIDKDGFTVTSIDSEDKDGFSILIVISKDQHPT